MGELLAQPHEEAVPVGDPPRWLRPLLAFQRAVDALNERIGKVSSYLVLAVVAVGFLNAVLRYAGRLAGEQLTSNRYLELQWYLYAAVFLLAFGYALRHGVNVRVDVWYTNRSPKVKALVDFVGHLLALLPFCVLALVVTWGPILTSWGARPDGSFRTWAVWQIWEQSPDPDGLPRAPVKTLLLVGFGLLLLQALAEMVKLLAELTGHGKMVVRRDATTEVEAEVRAQRTSGQAGGQASPAVGRRWLGQVRDLTHDDAAVVGDTAAQRAD